MQSCQNLHLSILLSMTIYTTNELDTAKIAYTAGGFYKGIAQSETHNVNIGIGYYSHNIHVWYGDAI